MGIFDKLMDTMHLGNDYEDDYDDYDDDFDDEPEPRGSLFKKKDKKYDYAYKKRSSWYGSLCIQTNSV